MNSISNISGVAPGVESLNGTASTQKDEFLQLLVTQMRFQDPLNPLDGKDFTAQLAQFSSLEELQNINGTMEQSIESNLLLARSINNTLASTIIGKNVKAGVNSVEYAGNGSTDISFDLPDNASETTVEILDSTGRVLKTIEVHNKNAGTHTVEWNGKDEQGNRIPEGSYQVSVTATRFDGSFMSAQPVFVGKVSGIKYVNGNPILIVNGRELSFGAVIEIHEDSDGASSGNNGDSNLVAKVLEMLK